MKLAILFLVAVLGQNAPQSCFPPSCRIDANCVDSIHSTSAKCCGGVCTSNTGAYGKLIGESCTPSYGSVDYFETCKGTCSPGLVCSDVDERCHALHGANCNCSSGADCLSGFCRTASSPTAQRVCGGVNLPNGEVCESNSECNSQLCNPAGKCAGLPPGSSCSPGFQLCEAPNTCRYNNTGYQCLPRCGLDEIGCCNSASDCVVSTPALQCTSSTCRVPPSPPGIDEACPGYICNNNTLLVCALQCNSTGFGYCASPRVCQLRRQLAAGAICDQTAQCPLNYTCAYNSSTGSYYCSPAPPPPTPIPLGGDCGSPFNYYQCASPGNMCQNNGSGYVCKARGATPLGDVCAIDTYRSYEECVNGTYCASAVSPTNYRCTAYPTPLPVGSPCTISYTPSVPTCEGGNANCGMFAGPPCYGSCSNPGCCTCFAPKTVPDGGKCNSTMNCRGADSYCATNGTCATVIGADCETRSECGGGSNKYDCNCDRKCYLLNPPTPMPTSRAPTAPTAPTPGRCEALKVAFQTAQPSFRFYGSSMNIYYYGFDAPGGNDQLVPQALLLPPADLIKLIDLVCCATCQSNNRFNTHIYRGYQVDCTAKTLKKLDDTCDDLRNSLAFLNCWAGVSPASTASLSFGAMLLIIFAVLM